KSLPPTHSKMPPALRLVAEGKVPTSVPDGCKALRNRIDDLAALDEEVLNQFGLPLWPCLAASPETEIVPLQNNGVGVARSVSAAPSESLFSATEATSEVELGPGKAIQLPVTGAPASVEFLFTKYGAERHVRVPI